LYSVIKEENVLFSNVLQNDGQWFQWSGLWTAIFVNYEYISLSVWNGLYQRIHQQPKIACFEAQNV